MSFDETTRPPRPGEEIDAGRLGAYLQELDPAFKALPHIRQFPSGHSNLTYLIRIGETELILRRPPAGRKPKSGHDMYREWKMISALKGHFNYVPEPVAFCEDTEVLGAPFFLMRPIRGLILRRDLPTGLEISPGKMRTLCEELIDVHCELHVLDPGDLGLEGLGHPEGYVERQISGWARRFRNARTPDVPDFEEIIAWLDAGRPAEQGASVIHNDYRFDNVVLDPEDSLRIIGVLDWEMATIGDPLMDLGASLAYWIEENDPPELQSIRLVPTHLPGALNRREVVRRYLEKAELELEDFSFYYVYGLFRLAGIAQQIYFRYTLGQSSDQRFAALGHAVRVLERQAHRVIEGGPV